MSQTTTSTFGGVLELVHAVEEAFAEIPCSVYDDGCSAPAKWWMVNPCGCRDAACTSCKTTIDAWVWSNLGRVVTCTICGARRLDLTDVHWERM